MKPFVLFLAISLMGLAPARSADSQLSQTLYVQLIRGSDDDAPPTPQAKSIGAELDHRLHAVFKWKNYWEIQRQCLALKTGEKLRAPAGPGREVEILLSQDGEMTVSLYIDGKLVRRRRQAARTRFYITGGDRDGSQSWFIVVRKDKPLNA